MMTEIIGWLSLFVIAEPARYSLRQKSISILVLCILTQY
jgi:hypothetical protein